jgi:histidine triad (HIT) family protein
MSMGRNQQEDVDQSKLFDNQNDSRNLIRRTDGGKGKLLACPFCEILRNQGKPEATRQVLFRDNTTGAILDSRPVFFGHTLVIPIKHYETLLDLPNEIITPLFSNARLIARAVKTTMKADGIFIGVNNIVSQSVPHLHIHVVPRKFGDGLRGFFWPRRNYKNTEEMNEISELIKQAIEAEIQSKI